MYITDLRTGGKVKVIRKKKVQVYRNLNKDCYSVQQSGKVIAHVHDITLTNVQFLVAKAGHRKVLETKRKNVHARVTGDIALPTGNRVSHLIKGCSVEGVARYNPYVSDKFINAVTYKPLHWANIAKLSEYDNTGKPFIKYWREWRYINGR